MSQLTTNHVKIVGVSACVPKTIEENIDLPLYESKEEVKKIIDSTGIERHRIVEKGTTASDLSVKAAEKIVADLGWEMDSVDLLLFVCTTRDYIQPMTSPTIQDRLGMRQDSYVMDLPLGCAGWVYGMSVATALMTSGTIKRGLLVCAETNTQSHNLNDRTSRPLFGDAATVTALEYDANYNHPMNYVFGVDGSGASAIMAQYGGFRNPVTPECLVEHEVEPGVFRKGTDIVLNGMDVFSFAIRRPPRSLKELIEVFQINLDEIDFLFLHQANRYIDDRIRKSLKFPEEKTPYCLNDYGNVSGASIPLTMVTRTAKEIAGIENHCLACGFGVGLSWASMEFYMENIKVSELVEY